MKAALLHLNLQDPTLAALIGRVGACRIRYSPPEYPTLVRSIVSQQLSAKAADTIHARLEAAAGRPGITPRTILRLPADRLRACGLSAPKVSYLKSLATSTEDGTIVFSRLARLDDHQVIETLTQVKGVGVWTAQMFLIFALRRRDVLPTGDQGIRNAAARLYSLPAPPDPAELELLAQPWRPYASIACWYLWRSLDLP